MALLCVRLVLFAGKLVLAVVFFFVFSYKRQEVTEESYYGVSEDLVQNAQMLYIKLNWNLLNHVGWRILIFLTLPTFLYRTILLTPFLWNLRWFLLLFYALYLACHYLIQIGQQFFFKSFSKHPQRVTNLYLCDFRGERDIFIALQQNHSNLILLALKPCYETSACNHGLTSNIHNLNLREHLRFVWERRICARIKLIQHKAAVFI